MKAFRWFFINACFAVLVISGLFVIGIGFLYLVFLFFPGGRL